MSNRLLQQVPPPALPLPPAQQSWLARLNDVLRVYFTRLSNAVNTLTGRHGGRFIEVPNALFYSTTDQPLVVVSTAQVISFEQTYLADGVSINGGSSSQITAGYSGIFRFGFQGQLRSSSASDKVVYVWLRRDGTDVGYSTKEYHLTGTGKSIEIAWDFIIDLQEDQYIEILWSSSSTDLSLDSTAATSPHPGVPSAVVSVNFVATLPEDLPALP